MTILETLQTDHRQVKVLLETILSTNDAKKRGDLFKQFRTELTAHSRVEEMVLYRRMEKSEEGKDDALEGAVEHEIVDRLMEDLSRSRKRRLRYGPLVARCSGASRAPHRRRGGRVFQDCSEDFRSRYSSQDGNSVHGRENQACECYHLKMRHRDGRAVFEI